MLHTVRGLSVIWVQMCCKIIEHNYRNIMYKLRTGNIPEKLLCELSKTSTYWCSSEENISVKGYF